MLRKSIVLVAILAAAAGLVRAGEKKVFVVGDVQLGYMGTTVPPQIRCIGGELTGLPFPQCSEGTQRVFGRSEVQTWGPVNPSESVVSLLNGLITFVVNCNMNASYRGPCWGTFEWDVPGVGIWEGTWTAPVMDLMTYESQISMVGHGMGGDIDGMQIKLDGGSAPGDWFITATVRIK
jgi:hypothetical protein